MKELVELTYEDFLNRNDSYPKDSFFGCILADFINKINTADSKSELFDELGEIIDDISVNRYDLGYEEGYEDGRDSFHYMPGVPAD